MTAALVTGAAGFVGRALCAALLRGGWRVRAAMRAAAPIDGVEAGVIGDLAEASWEPALQGIGVVFHLAATVHTRGSEALYQAVNVEGTERVARAAARAGVRRLVFASTIKVNGEATAAGAAFRAGDAPHPQDAYARSKWRAEQALARVAAETGLEVVIVRPPLVYGPGVRANFLRLLKLVDSGLPLPFASIRNRRSLLYVGNLAALLVRSATASGCAGKTFLAADGEDLGTPELVRCMGAALGRPARLLPFPAALLPPKLRDSLVVDIADTRAALGWQPPHTVDEGLRATAQWLRAR